ncbi:DoxX family protein [Stenotrophomonas maltophilia]|uniref:DoxX family protein n=1 Tax=Stenotrophomonas maltophilia (strain R551-3) TaxID=391008 RepID=B4SIT1_STRM5|nr:DoxX family protein [Stenotrophomonas maltophilia]ACF51670.1 DoxX family protein [Stenotrophomonas maltophilia R551-3]MBA0393908.1 DoxX family protein [Stenotrophomonas maltophilia]MBH1493078.1 DoxX family protein [Stenotrophomonas maltophilia]MBN4960851.1 DoxX family protein [Stenotrophomonas maltophilia]MBN5140996.1 DoxX family protein [Stenotrophomonas maltophilia]
MSTYSTTLAASSSIRVLGAIELLGRLLLVSLFLMSGFGKLSAYEATAGYMASVGVPALMLPLVILAEIGGALAIIAGWQTRIVAVLLAGFTLATAFLFHNNVADQTQMIMFLKNVSIAGAFLMLAANGAGRFSLDARKTR